MAISVVEEHTSRRYSGKILLPALSGLAIQRFLLVFADMLEGVNALEPVFTLLRNPGINFVFSLFTVVMAALAINEAIGSWRRPWVSVAIASIVLFLILTLLTAFAIDTPCQARTVGFVSASNIPVYRVPDDPNGQTTERVGSTLTIIGHNGYGNNDQRLWYLFRKQHNGVTGTTMASTEYWVHANNVRLEGSLACNNLDIIAGTYWLY